jgi:CRP/FNR family cyclic AMP-dependent transcriptional regulator
MISPELLYRYPFFGGLDNSQVKAIAMIAQQILLENGETIFHEGQPAEWLYFLEDGCVSLYYMGTGTTIEKQREGIHVGDINPGEPFSISALIEPYILTATARATKPCRVIKIEAEALKTLFKQDQGLAYILTLKAAKAVVDRLNTTRVQLAAAWA